MKKLILLTMSYMVPIFALNLTPLDFDCEIEVRVIKNLENKNDSSYSSGFFFCDDGTWSKAMYKDDEEVVEIKPLGGQKFTATYKYNNNKVVFDTNTGVEVTKAMIFNNTNGTVVIRINKVKK
jgi:hypothetical protein